ncbi:Aminopeptidase [Aphelenchoides fujianensis]|nr:Aminopeptidase [Aphelenchoides fujianensis]
MAAEKFEKLPTFARPTNYWLHLEPNLQTFKFNGKEVIDVEVLEPTRFLKLHADEIEIKAAALKLADGKEWNDLAVKLDKRWKTLTVELPDELPPQAVKLCLDFVGEHNETMAGFYRSSYKNAAGESRTIVSTQFESEAARKAFPCWDEPLFKATFEIELAIDPQLTGLSNMNVVSETKTESGLKLLKYAPTPVMSTYLVAFAVGKFEYLEAASEAGVLMRVYTMPGKKAEGEYALEVATKVLDYFNEWFDHPYPLPKCDLIAIPNFAMGAMEKWWNDLWLKEGFASFMSYVAVGDLYPQLNVWTSFLSDEMIGAFAMDSLRSSHPIEVPINDPSELSSIYDAITYRKSNSLLRTLYRYLGAEKFKDGLRRYVRKHQYKNTVTTDLWAALSEASGEDIGRLMTSWTQQMGFPVISASDETSGNTRTIRLKQTRFLADGTTDETLWLVPVTVVTKAGVQQKFVMSEKEHSVTLEGLQPDDWIKLNSEFSGFYRVQYHDVMMQRLMAAVKSRELNAADRFNLADDLCALVKAGRASAAQFLAFYEASANEDEFIVWQTLDGGIRAFLNVLDHHEPELKRRLEKFVHKTLDPVIKRVGFEAQSGEDPNRSQLRGLLLATLSKVGHEETTHFALQKFDEFVTKQTPIPNDLRTAVFCVVGRHRSDGVEQLRKVYETCGSAEIRRDTLYGLQQTPKREKREQVFDYAILQGNVQSQDWIHLFLACSTGNKAQQDKAWAFFAANQERLVKAYGATTEGLFQRCFSATTGCQSTAKFLKEMEDFVQSTYDADGRKGFARVYDQSVESIRLNEQLAKNQMAAITRFLNAS